MLKVASFPITDAAGVNELLSKYRLAQGAHILVSDGNVMIPYEDGEQPNKAQRSVKIKEVQNEQREQIADLEHSQDVVALQIADAQDAFNVAEAAWKKALSNKALEKVMHEREAQLEEAKNLKRRNDHEIVRLTRNIDLYDEQLKNLKD